MSLYNQPQQDQSFMPTEPLPSRIASIPRIPSLDGLRALSIFLVLALHTIQRFATNRPVSLIWYAVFDGATGVLMFFVISGYLITTLLLSEQRKRGSISMRGFYLRRAMRILPPLYAYVIVVLLLGWAGRLPLDRIDILSALFFFHNYAPATMWSLQHFWSLSTEEQFYLLWPVILLYCLRKPGIAGRVTASKIALAVILISPVVRVVSFRFNLPYLHNGYGFHMFVDALMYGCVFALLQGTPVFERVYAFATKIWWIPPAVIFLSDCLRARFTNYWQLPFGYTICGAAIAFFLLWCVRNPTSVLGRVLNARPIVRIGVLSYSIYLWQTLFLNYDNIPLFGRSLKLLTIFPLSWLVILAVAELSFYLVERPSLNLRNRLIREFHLYVSRRQRTQTPQ
jgi:peptidoglycan/LPS O-acetylase OafA/YrhL